jgi:hypothetical protein
MEHASRSLRSETSRTVSSNPIVEEATGWMPGLGIARCSDGGACCGERRTSVSSVARVKAQVQDARTQSRKVSNTVAILDRFLRQMQTGVRDLRENISLPVW